ncbi:hypothetical protein [Planomicrobium okeanokoites]|uniref:hypothetical protein n=1 Tax=Planomicrobium okeanokoites TaxID=244 RepID=UPI00249342D2|nr:hypothetical protein [Planomicrobium okeanokoites]
MNSIEKNSKTLPVKKTIRSKLIQRVRITRNTPTSQVEKNGQDAVAITRLPGRRQAGAISKVPRGIRKKRRTGPGGKIARVSDEAVERIAADMEKRTRQAIRIIGLSRGF